MTRIVTDDAHEHSWCPVSGKGRGITVPFGFDGTTQYFNCWCGATKTEQVSFPVEHGRPVVHDRRTGPKCRRVERDDSRFYYGRNTQKGRRHDDSRWHHLPRKSDRLKREAAERAKREADEVKVSEGMKGAGVKAACKWWSNPKSEHGEQFSMIYTAMELQRRKEEGEKRPHPVQWSHSRPHDDSAYTHRRHTDPGFTGTPAEPRPKWETGVGPYHTHRRHDD